MLMTLRFDDHPLVRDVAGDLAHPESIDQDARFAGRAPPERPVPEPRATKRDALVVAAPDDLVVRAW